jgi:hypothetical protein
VDRRVQVREDQMNERLAFGSPLDGLLDRLYARDVAQSEALFDFIRDPRNELRTMTLPFEGGLEFTVRAR